MIGSMIATGIAGCFAASCYSSSISSENSCGVSYRVEHRQWMEKRTGERYEENQAENFRNKNIDFLSDREVLRSILRQALLGYAGTRL